MRLHGKKTENIVYIRVWTICDKEYIMVYVSFMVKYDEVMGSRVKS